MIIYFTDKFAGSREESHKLLEKALAVHTGDEIQARKLIGALETGEHGKPYIEGFSCFSISHTGSIWAILVADRECGLDIQSSRKGNYKAVAERFFAPKDASAIASSTDDESTEAQDMFFLLWTRREALVKALGATVYDPDIPAVSDECVDIEGKEYALRNIRIPELPELYAAVCLEDHISECELDACRFEKLGQL